MRIYSKKAFALGEGANRYDDKVNSDNYCAYDFSGYS